MSVFKRWVDLVRRDDEFDYGGDDWSQRSWYWSDVCVPCSARSNCDGPRETDMRTASEGNQMGVVSRNDNTPLPSVDWDVLPRRAEDEERNGPFALPPGTSLRFDCYL